MTHARWLVAAGIVAVVAVAAVVVALRSAESWIETNRGWIDTRLEDALGRPVSFGAVSLSFFPSLAVRVADVRVENDGGGPEPLLAADSARVVVAILPALAGRVAVRRVDVESPAITLARGEANDDASGTRAQSRRPAARRGGPPSPLDEAVAAVQELAATVASLPLAVGSVRVVDGRLRLVDRPGNSAPLLDAHDVDLSASGIGGDRAARLAAKMALFDAGEQNVTLDGTIGPYDRADPARTPVDVEMAGTALDLVRLRAALPELDAAMPKPLVVEGPFDARAAVKGGVRAPGFEARLDATSARVAWADWFAKPPGMPLAMTATGTRAGAGARFERFEAQLADLVATGRGDASPETVALHVAAEPFAAAPLAQLLPQLGTRRLGGEIGFAVDVTGPVSEGRTPAITGTAMLRDFSVVSDDPPLRITDVSQTIALRGDVAALPPTSLQVDGTPVTVSGRVERFTSPVMRLADLDVGIFGGRITGDAEIDRGATPEPRFSTALVMRDLDVAAAVAMRAPDMARTLAGRLSGRMSLHGGGRRGATMRERLDGQGHAAVANGALRGLNLGERVLSGVTRVPGLSALLPAKLSQRYPSIFGGEDTRFDEMTATWRLAGGTLHLDRVALATRDYTVDARGTLARDDRLQANGTLELSADLTDELTRLPRNARGRVAIPFVAEGRWPRVVVTPDVRGIARTVPREAVKQGLERLLDDGLDRLFKKR